MRGVVTPDRVAAARRWARRNLFRNAVDGVVTVVSSVVIGYLLWRAVRFVLVTGRWEVIQVNLKLFMVGRYPDLHLPRVGVSLGVAAAVGGLLAGIVHRRQVLAGTSVVAGMSVTTRLTDLLERFWPVVLGVGLLLGMTGTAGPWLVALGVAAGCLVGRLVGARLPKWTHAVVIVLAVATPFALVAYLADASGWDGWGGLMLNVFMALASMILCFPLGVLAALGRRSKLPVLRGIATVYIELLRGAPLFVLLLMANVALGFFVPPELVPGRVVRAIVVFTLFTGAYMAEIVRGGLQSVPRGQEEAARALGLSPTRITFLIVLPQALRNVIPAQVGQLISLFKDTTLAGVAMGLFELLQVAGAATSQTAFRGQRLGPEVYAFAALLFWLGSYTMSRESQRIERKLGVGQR
jgi:general L-amino acid transport system permease protein